MKLKEIAEISTGYSFRTKIKHHPSGETKVIQMGDVDKYEGILVEKLQTLRDFDPRNDRYFLKAGDVIMISKGYNIDAFVIPENLGRAVTINSFLVMKPDLHRILPEYLAWFLNSKRAQYFFKEMAAGTNVPNLSIKALEALEVVLPSLDEQQRIANLDTLKRREIYLHKEIAAKKEQLIDELLQQQIDKLNSK
ncbi:MAG: restriction endonuclease subunit S [Gracilimonas sp.]|uniref:restriction endonuclease subunit S n=1 Tax=Gracilimonas sp. TaxID=1974203 RepID=UPI001B200E3E|nr:restriction endonuclease subunit S [Gracilimonas sp.]MBO6584745.1 restriction endonuclease subunit S [Gracilimonas sp.]MBO6615984.1 restriction endonuclease subunit S [Gracilimonas sp.]